MARVLHCMWSGEIGGAERAVFQFIRSQIQLSRHEPAIAYSRATGFYKEEIEKLGVEVIDLGLESDMAFGQVGKIKRLMERFDIHHFNSAEVTPISASVLCRNARRVYNHRSGDFAYSGRQRVRYEIVGYFVRNHFHAMTGNTRRACISGARVTRTNVDRWRTIYNGVDFSMLEPRRSADEVAREIGLDLDGPLVIGTSAHLRDWKRIELLIEGCAKLDPSSYRLVIVGDGPVRGELEALARNLGIDSRTIFTGMKEHVGDYLQLMDAFVLPSSNAESFGNSAVEAMSQGLPTIVFSDGGGLVEHVDTGATGYIVESVDDLAGRLATLAADRDLGRRLGDAAREHVTKKYSYENLVRSYDGLYDEVLGNGERGAGSGKR